MTIFNYDSLPEIEVPYILRDEDNQSVGVWVTNQETKETVFCDEGVTSYFYNDFFTVDITAILTEVTKDTTLLVSAIDDNDLPIYRDIVVFSTRLDTVNDYEQNDTDGKYVFA